MAITELVRRDYRLPLTKSKMQRLLRAMFRKTLTQITAADATLFVCYVEQDSILKHFGAIIGAVCAANESMTIDIHVNGVSILTGVATINDVGEAANTYIDFSSLIDTAELSQGDVIFAVLNYTAGGGPTPLAGTQVVLEYIPDWADDV